MDDAALREKVRTLIIQSSRLKIAAAAIRDDQSLFRDNGGLGLDSIDVLELVVNLERHFGLTIEDRETAMKVLRTVNTVVDAVKSKGKKL